MSTNALLSLVAKTSRVVPCKKDAVGWGCGPEVEPVERGPLGPDETAVAIARAGDIFELGPHRVVCGDATNPAVLRLLIDSLDEAKGGVPASVGRALVAEPARTAEN